MKMIVKYKQTYYSTVNDTFLPYSELILVKLLWSTV